MLTPDVQIDHGGSEVGMPHQLADREQVDARFEQPVAQLRRMVCGVTAGLLILVLATASLQAF